MRLLRVLPVLVALAAGEAHATTTVRLVPADTSLVLGQETSLQILADFDLPVVGFGLDLVLTGLGVTALDDLAVGPDWTPVPAPDGDGLAGLGPTSGLVGMDVLLASVTLQAFVPGATELGAATTPGDLTEGFALLGGGFDDVVFQPSVVEVVPEPTTAVLVTCGLLVSLLGGGGRAGGAQRVVRIAKGSAT